MNGTLEGASPWDVFFYYGKIDLIDEVMHDIYELLLQPSRSMFYFRDGAGGVSSYENYPIGIQMILLKYEIANAIAKRNNYVSNGELATRDRRAATSQEYITIEMNSNGEMTVGVTFFLYNDYQNPKNTNFLLKN